MQDSPASPDFSKVYARVGEVLTESQEFVAPEKLRRFQLKRTKECWLSPRANRLGEFSEATGYVGFGRTKLVGESILFVLSVLGGLTSRQIELFLSFRESVFGVSIAPLLEKILAFRPEVHRAGERFVGKRRGDDLFFLFETPAPAQGTVA